MATTYNDKRLALQKTHTTAQQFAEEHWNKAAQVLSERPSLMTRHVLILVLKNRPPPHVIEFMLSLNPHAADIPPQGPSPLQVAVRHNASVDVIRLVIQACPLALVATHSGYDPLMYAKIWRREEPELMALLSKPLSYWVQRHKDASSRVFLDSDSTTTTRTPPAIQASSKYTATTPSEEEVNNIKKIAAAIVRAQKNQVAALQQHRREVDEQLENLKRKQQQERLHQLRELERLQQQHFKAQLVALDMKERRILARVKKVERRIHKTMELTHKTRQVRERRYDVTLDRVEEKVNTIRGTLHEWEARTNTRLEMAELRLDQESRVNDYFRSDTRLQLDQLEFRSSVMQGWAVPKEEELTPVVYATPYVVEEDDDAELDSVVPLWPNEDRSSRCRSRNTNARQQKRSYPTRRKKRHLLGALNF